MPNDDTFLSKLNTAKTTKRRFTIYLSKETAKMLKVYAAKHDKKLSDVIEEVLIKELKDS